MSKTSFTVKKFVCRKCKHEVTYHTDIDTAKPEVCSMCQGKDFQEKRSES